MKIFAAIGVLALVLASAGVAMATTRSAAPKTARACVTASHALKLVSGGRCPAGTKAISLVGTGGPGTALGYAHIKPFTGGFDSARSFNVKASNVVSTSTGFYCFKGLKFTPHNATLTLDYNGTLNGQIPTVELRLPPHPGDCGLSSAQAEVFTGLVTPGGFTAGTKIGFYVIFY
jgi:hypothetical protein